MLNKIMNSKISSYVLAIACFFFILTFSIGLPIYFRPFYYLHINALELPRFSGRTYEGIKAAYDELLDYLVFGTPFRMGDFKYSFDGYSHFADCKVLFDINGAVLATTAAILAFFVLCRAITKKTLPRLFGYSPVFWSGAILLFLIAVVGIWGAIDFDGLFIAFHTVFFHGKTNWWFDPAVDEIINVMPEEFFRNAAILIAVAVVALSVSAVIFGVKAKKRENLTI